LGSIERRRPERTVGCQLVDRHVGKRRALARRRQPGRAEILLDPADLVAEPGGRREHGHRGE
jgi:hypothetical protein